MTEQTLRTGIIGAGNIAGPYASDLKGNYPFLSLTGVTDLDGERAAQFAAEHEIQAYADLDALLADVDIAINLTSHTAHKAITTRCFEAGVHVYSEKPIATNYADARALVELADEKGLRLGCSPFTLAGEAQQTAWKLIREGKLGDVRVAYAEVNWGRIESWHPAPEGFYAIGALYDVGVYPLTILTAMFGAARRVTAYGTVLHADRVTKEGRPFHIETPDFAVSLLEMASGTVVRLTTNFYVNNQKQMGITFHGDAGSLYMESWHSFDSVLEHADFGGDYAPVELVRPPTKGTPWGRGVAELATAIIEDRPHRFNGAHAAHVSEILDAAAQSMREGHPVDIGSSFEAPAPYPWSE